MIYSWQDIREQKITMIRLAAGFVIAFGMGIVFREMEEPQELGVWNNISLGMKGMLPGVFLFLLAFAMKDCMGLGDGLVLSIVGALIGFERAVCLISLALFFSFIYSCILIICKKRKKSFPFVPFYIPATFLLWCGGG